MSVLTCPCPRCSSTLEFAWRRQTDVVDATCERCGGEYALGPSGVVPLPPRCAAELRTQPMPGVRAALLAKYQAIVAQYPDSRSWFERLEAVCVGDILVEPGWLLKQVVGDEIDPYGLYRIYPDGRIAPVSRLAKRFLDAIESGTPALPGIGEGLRVQKIIDLARLSHQSGAKRIVVDQ